MHHKQEASILAKWIYPLAGLVTIAPSYAVISNYWPSGFIILGTIVTLMHTALFFHYRFPGTVTIIIYSGALTHYLLGAHFLPSDLLVIFAVFSATRYGNNRVKIFGLVGALAGAILQGFTVPITVGYGNNPFEYILLSLLFTAIIATAVLAFWALANLRISRTASWVALQERNDFLEREKEQQIVLATAAERGRIAREMHDIIAHSLSVVIAQADGGKYAKTDIERLNTLDNISEISREALADMRNVLGVLREKDSSPSLSPQPDSLDIRKLVDQVKESGLKVSFVEVGQGRQLPPGVGLSIFRITQESLTNVMKHAGPEAAATVLLHWQPGRIILQIDDDGRGASVSSDGRGQGVVGMRERTQMLGGTLISGPRPGGGFRIRADIPIPLFTERTE